MLRLLYRMPWFVSVLSLGLVLAIGMRSLFGRAWLQHPRGGQVYRWWQRRAAQSLGLKVVTLGKPNPSPTLLVANHISWVDIVAVGSHSVTHFVAKQEVRRWPLIGALAGLAGTLFIERSNRRAMVAAIDKLADTLRQGSSVVLFPEATTTDGQRVEKFHQGLFEAARLAGTTVQPVAIRYSIEGEPDHRIAPYIDDDTFLMHLLRMMRSPATEVVVQYLTPISSHNQTRTQLCELSHKLISDEIIGATNLRQAA